MAKRDDWVYDELLCFLGNPFFQVPVLTFMESKCLIFDPSIEDSEEYKKVHQEYKAIIQKLLDAFIKDTGISHDQVIKAVQDMNRRKEIKEMFQSLFEQFFAAEDYTIFVRLMVQKNIELQQQALAMIMQMQGALPESLSEGTSKPSTSAPPAPSNEQYGAQNEEEILKAVLEQSKREYEEEQKKKKTVEEEEMKKEMESLITISKVEHSRLEEEKSKEKTKLDQALFGMTLNESAPQTSASSKPPAGNTKPPPKPQTDLKSAPSISVTPAAPQSAAPPPKPAEPVPAASVTAAIASQKLPSVGQQKPQMSSAEAAANWLKQTDDTPTSNKPSTSAVQAAAAAMSNMNSEELKKRQEFLKQQRDKLLEMKKKEREKQLLAAEKSQPKRPVSARMAKSAMEDGVSEKSNKLSPEEEKKMAMRKAIADRLKAEMLGK
ncbi:cilia- and flagella-associated protein 36-like [Saccostrea cucullata]|uniref:cilia- and flagella-associated protein 36-like n=1 Tax=Saccostrea cuccullata TaxID=36930 RepID=UPI002ED51B5C